MDENWLWMRLEEKYLSFQDALNVGLASSTHFKLMEGFIADKLVLRQPPFNPSKHYHNIKEFVDVYRTHISFSPLFNSPVNDLPPSVTHLYFARDFNQKVDNLPPNLLFLSFKDPVEGTIEKFNQPINNLPPTLTHLILSILFNQPVDHLPASLTHLTFGNKFNHPVDHLPASLTHLSFGYEEHKIPPSLAHIVFNAEFNQSISELPSGITHLKIFSRYSCVRSLPKSLLYVDFGEFFNEPLDLDLVQACPHLTHLYMKNNQNVPSDLPPTLTHLDVYGCGIKSFPPNLIYMKLQGLWSYPLTFASLPRSLQHLALTAHPYLLPDISSLPPNLLYFDCDFNKPINVLPLQKLIFGDSFTHSIESLPPALTHLEFWGRFNAQVDNILPPSITHLKFSEAFNKSVDFLPQSLIELHFFGFFNQKIDFLPSALRRLVFSSNSRFNQPVDNLPTNLLHLQFGDDFNNPVDHLPSKLTHLIFKCNFNQNIDNLPDSINELNLGELFQHPIQKLPQSLVHLTFGQNFNATIDSFPAHLSVLQLGERFNQPLNHLPDSLTHLTLGSHFSSNNIQKFPPKLTHLNFGSYSKIFPLFPRTLTHLSVRFVYPGIGLPQRLQELNLSLPGKACPEWEHRMAMKAGKVKWEEASDPIDQEYIQPKPQELNKTEEMTHNKKGEQCYLS